MSKSTKQRNRFRRDTRADLILSTPSPKPTDRKALAALCPDTTTRAPSLSLEIPYVAGSQFLFISRRHT